MALRVLGYKTVVEAKGTWPTNYIAKAEELDLLEDITYGTYATGAKRGNVALLIWNMLRENMWDVKEESEGTGLTYGQSSTMLNKKFKDYRYFTTWFEGYEIKEEGKITVLVSGDSFEYAKPDFYTFVPGSEIEVLVNTKDDVLLSMVETDEYKYLAGGKETIDEEYDNVSGEVYDYAFARIYGKNVAAMTELMVESTYIYELDTDNSKYIKYNDSASNKLRYESFEDEVVLKDGEFASIKDLEVGDVWSKVTVYTKQGTANRAENTFGEFYVISGAEDEGKLTKLFEEEFDMPAPKAVYHVATIDGEEYVVTSGDKAAVYFEDAEDEDPKGIFLAASSNDKKDMKNEVVTFVTDFLGRIVAVTFDGELNGGDENSDEASADFFALKGLVKRDEDLYKLVVENEDGEQTLTFAKNVGNSLWIAGTDLSGIYTMVKLNDDGEIVALHMDASGEAMSVNGLINSGDLDAMVRNISGDELEYNEDGDAYDVIGSSAVTFDENKLYSGDTLLARVNEDTVVVTLVYDDADTTLDTTDDEYSVTFSAVEDIENLKNDRAIIITDNATNFARAKYVVIFDEVSSREDDLLGIVKSVKSNDLGDTIITIVESRNDIEEDEDGVEYTLDTTSLPAGIAAAKDLEELFIVYSVEEVEDEDYDKLTATVALLDAQLAKPYGGHAYIAKSEDGDNVSSNGREAVIKNANSAITALLNAKGELVLDDEEVEEYFEDARIVVLEVTLDLDTEDENQYYAESYEEITYAEAALKELDRISFLMDGTKVEGVVIIRGIK